MAKTIFVITEAHNEYDQHGDYFQVLFYKKPTLNELSYFLFNKKLEALSDDDILKVTHLSKGGGRQNNEGSWYFLTEISHGVRYKHTNE